MARVWVVLRPFLIALKHRTCTSAALSSIPWLSSPAFVAAEAPTALQRPLTLAGIPDPTRWVPSGLT